MKKLSVIKGLSGLAVMAMTICIMTFSSYAAQGEITAETARIRANTSTDSEVVGSTVKGKTIDILEAVKDSSGAVWYKVSVAEGGYGYIKGDLVKVSGDIEITSTSDSQPQENSSQSAQQPADTVPTSIGEQQAVIKSGNNVNVRTGASKEHAAVASLPSGTSITLIGEANDSAGNKWYQMTCSYNGRTVEGYVRSDLIEIGQGSAPAEGGGEGTEAPAEGTPEGGGEGTEAPPEGENPEGGEGEAPEEGEAAPEPAEEHNDYEVHYDLNAATNEYEYYLYLNNEGNKMRISELLSASTAAMEGMQKLQAQVDKEKIVIIILAAVVVVLFIVITILLFKIRSLYYEDYDEEEDEEEEEEEEEPAPVRRKVRKRVEEEEEAPVPVKKKRPPVDSDNRERTPRPRERSAQPPARGEKELHAAERKEPAKKPVSRKPQNFLIDDDEFEFEFLNMDDKDI